MLISIMLGVTMIILIMLAVFLLLIGGPCLKINTGPDPDDLEYIGNNRYRHKKTGAIYRWDQNIGAS